MRELTNSEKQILKNHQKWINFDPDGIRANLCRADLCEAKLREADLRLAKLREADLRGAYLCGANLCRADLRRADLCGADLRKTNLRGANLDYACWPLWCGSLDVIIDKRIFAQLAYHLCRTVCDDPEVREAQRSLRHIANQSHYVDECGMIGDGGDD